MLIPSRVDETPFRVELSPVAFLFVVSLSASSNSSEVRQVRLDVLYRIGAFKCSRLLHSSWRSVKLGMAITRTDNRSCGYAM
jgi:hypothetical protein